MTVFSIIMFFFPEGGGYFIEMANFQEANPLVTPDHIAPVWYYAPFYTMLRAIPDPLGGLIVMAAAVAIFFIVPWLDRSNVASIRYKGIYHLDANFRQYLSNVYKNYCVFIFNSYV